MILAIISNRVTSTKILMFHHMHKEWNTYALPPWRPQVAALRWGLDLETVFA